ncbi:MAG: sugar-binding protein [Caldilinea sp.]
MANPEDFEIISDDTPDTPPPARSRVWLWVAGAAILFVFAFAVGAGWSTLTDRLGPGASTEAPIVAVTSLPGGTPTVVATDATQTATPADAPVAPDATPTPLPATPTNTPQPSPTSPPPTRVCTAPLDPQFTALFDPGALGCPTAATSIVWSAYERFERGAMLWRSDTNLTYILYGDGTWTPSNETWDGREAPWRGDPPSGLYRPERGFGYVWGVRDDVFARLGWATMPEKGFCAAIQPFEQGFALAGAAVASCTPENLYNHVFDADWRPLLYAFENNGRWRSAETVWAPGGATPAGATPGAATPAITPTAMPTVVSIVDTSMRPVQNGVFTARRGQPAALDGRFDDWTGPWVPINAVIQGRTQWTGPSDLSAAFQVMWAAEGLYLAISVNDDTLRAAPEGSDLWQGDGVEVQFDRLLADDYADTLANDDDTQLGLAPDDSFLYVRGYRWLPLSGEARFDPPGAVTRTPTQYAMEVLIPWLYFDISAAELRPDLRFGFNVSINDNDGDTPAQQSVISASPARTTHDNPTEWGTLILED